MRSLGIGKCVRKAVLGRMKTGEPAEPCSQMKVHEQRSGYKKTVEPASDVLMLRDRDSLLCGLVPVTAPSHGHIRQAPGRHLPGSGHQKLFGVAAVCRAATGPVCRDYGLSIHHTASNVIS